MRDALLATGRDIVFSICNFGIQNPWTWFDEKGHIGHMWRTTFDIRPHWECPHMEHQPCIKEIIEQNSVLYNFGGRGIGWNDPDMLVVGARGHHITNVQKFGPTIGETLQKVHFMLWAIMNAPLFTGNDVRDMSDFTLRVLTAKEIIAVDQDATYQQGRRIRQQGNQEVWHKKLYDGVVILFFNYGNEVSNMTVSLLDLELDGYIVSKGGEFNINIRDIWEEKDINVVPYSESFVYSAEVKAEDAEMLKFSIVQ